MKCLVLKGRLNLFDSFHRWGDGFLDLTKDVAGGVWRRGRAPCVRHPVDRKFNSRGRHLVCDRLRVCHGLAGL